MTGAGQPVDICNQWVIIEDVCHRIIRDQDKSWIDGKGQIKNVPFGDDISRTVDSDLRLDLMFRNSIVLRQGMFGASSGEEVCEIVAIPRANRNAILWSHWILRSSEEQQIAALVEDRSDAQPVQK